MFIAVLFTIAKTWKQPRCPSKDEWIKKMWHIYIHIYIYRYIYTYVHTHNGILLNHKKRMKFCHLQLRGWTWRALC